MRATFDHSEQHGPHTFSYYFRPERKLRFEAGQFVEITLQHDQPDDRGAKRWYSLSSAPSAELLSITTQLADKSSTFKRQLQVLQPGDTILVSEPLGDFVLPIDTSIPLIFIAEDIGITPYLSIARQLLASGEKRQIELFYMTDDGLFTDELQAAGYKVNLIPLKASPDLKLVEGAIYYVSGSESLTKKMDAALTTLGVPASQMVTDYFPGY